MVPLTASDRLVETDSHIAPAAGCRVTGTRSVTSAVSMAVEVCVRLLLCDFAAGAPAPTTEHRNDQREVRSCLKSRGR